MKKLAILTGVVGLALGLAAPNPAEAQLVPVVTETGLISLSVDGLGTTGGTGTIDVLKPSALATVRTARFACASTGFSNFVIPNGGVTINGVGVTWSATVPSSISSNNQIADVTAQMAGILDPAAAGITSFTIVELSPFQIDGCLLAVIFDDPADTFVHTAILLFGALSTTGDTFNIALANPINLAEVNLVLDFGLGISFGAQDQSGPGGSNLCGQQSAMNTIVDVNLMRLTSCAGNLDDALTTESVSNGNLFTVGGLGDSNANPLFPFLGAPQPLPSFVEDELYDLIPFVSDGDTNIVVDTINPSNDDNVLWAHLFTLGVASLGEEVMIDIKFLSDPNGYNCKKKGGLPVLIFGMDGLDVRDIDVSTLRLVRADGNGGVVGPPTLRKDSAGGPFEDRGDPDLDKGISTEDGEMPIPDGFEDLSVSFDSRDIADLIDCDMIWKGDPSPTLVLVGNLLDGTSIFSTALDDLGIDQLLIKNN